MISPKPGDLATPVCERTPMFASIMKILLRSVALVGLLAVVTNGQAPVKPPVLLLPSSMHHCSGCSKRAPVVADGLAGTYSTKLPECDRIEVFLLGGNLQKDAVGDGFPIRPESCTALIERRVVMKGDEASKLSSLWRGLTFDDEESPVITHGRTFGLRYYQADKLLFETTISFSRQRFYYPRTAFPMDPGKHSWHGFRTYDKAGDALRSFLEALFSDKGQPPKS